MSSVAGGEAWGRFSPLLGQRRGLAESAGLIDRRLAARYDSAQTGDDNRNHWAMADALSADAANSPGVRTILRNRSRYEVANNCYASGVGLTIANDCIGTGPRLNLTTDSESLNNLVEERFAAWCRAVNLAELLRTMRQSRRQDGESFCLMVHNPGIEDPVKLGLRLIEADQVASFDLPVDDRRIDGIRFDPWGNVQAYDILRNHPGSILTTGSTQYDIWPARYVLHWFRPRRAGQHHGIPELLAALPLYATLRRYTQATLDAAESAADMAILLHTQSGAEFEDDEGQQSPESFAPFTSVPFQRRMMVALPQGYDATQIKPEQPTQQYAGFKREVAGEIGRCENVSRNVVLLDSSESNFASGQLDHKITYRQHDIDRDTAGIVLMDRIFRTWLEEASLVSGYLPSAVRIDAGSAAPLPPRAWHWDSNELGDLLKLAKAKAEELRCGLASLPALYAAKGQDWTKALKLAARGYGISEQELLALIRGSIFSTGQAKQPAGQEDEDEPAQPPKGGSGSVKQGDKS